LSGTGPVLVLVTLVGLALRLYQLTRPRYLTGVTEYDDGVDFGSAVLLVHGHLPYRDFLMVQPPGITLLMAPVALLSTGTGTAHALAVGRVLTACAGAASVPLGGALARRHGRPATGAVGGILAVHPAAVAAAHTVLLEPWLVLCCLLGVRVSFDGNHLAARNRRLFLGGVLFGVAGGIKVWAIIPVVVVAVLCLPSIRRLARFAGGVAVGFAVAVLPFAVSAPATFVHSVVVTQLERTDTAWTPLWTRLGGITGAAGSPHLVVLAIAALAVGGPVAGYVSAGRRLTELEWFALGTAALVVAAFCWPDDYYYHYAAFLTPFLALAVVLPLARIRLACLVVLLAVTAMACGDVVTIDGSAAADPGVAAFIPPGACVLTDEVSLTIAANRFRSADPDCPVPLDGIGTDYALSDGRNAVTGAGGVGAVASVWLAAFRHAQYVWLSGAADRRIPWTPAIRAYFARHFVPEPVPGLYVRRPACRC
jgi:hypothetical protein